MSLGTSDHIRTGDNVMDEENPQPVRFPALGFKKGWLYAIGSMDDISRSSRRGFRKGTYKNLLLVDFIGNTFHVTGARKIGTLVRFDFGSLLGLVTGNPTWQVELTFAFDGHATLDRVKALIVECFKEKKDYWEEMVRFEEFRDKILKAESLERVFAAFEEFHQL